ncbi:MAG: hypothetical protein AAGH89_09845 [Verrucomicrobiota bacterium]
MLLLTRFPLLLALFIASSANGNSVDALREQEKSDRDLNIDAAHQDKLAVLQIKYQLALEKRYQRAIEAGANAIAAELKNEQLSFTYDGKAIDEPRTPLLQTLRETWSAGVERLEEQRHAHLLEHYQSALSAGKDLLEAEPDSASVAAYVRELELEVDAMEQESFDTSSFTDWLIRQWVPSRIDHLRFYEDGVMLGDLQGRETRLAMWKYAPSKHTVFWRSKGVLQTLVIREGSRFATYNEEGGPEYELKVEPLPEWGSWSEAMVGKWARLFGQGNVRRLSRYQLSFADDATALYGTGQDEPPLKGSWKITDDELTVEYEDGTRDVVLFPINDSKALSLRGTHFDEGREWSFTLVRMMY